MLITSNRILLNYPSCFDNHSLWPLDGFNEEYSFPSQQNDNWVIGVCETRCASIFFIAGRNYKNPPAHGKVTSACISKHVFYCANHSLWLSGNGYKDHPPASQQKNRRARIQAHRYLFIVLNSVLLATKRVPKHYLWLLIDVGRNHPFTNQQKKNDRMHNSNHKRTIHASGTFGLPFPSPIALLARVGQQLRFLM